MHLYFGLIDAFVFVCNPCFPPALYLQHPQFNRKEWQGAEVCDQEWHWPQHLCLEEESQNTVSKGKLHIYAVLTSQNAVPKGKVHMYAVLTSQNTVPKGKVHIYAVLKSQNTAPKGKVYIYAVLKNIQREVALFMGSGGWKRIAIR